MIPQQGDTFVKVTTSSLTLLGTAENQDMKYLQRFDLG
jgi:hypothetical protein